MARRFARPALACNSQSGGHDEIIRDDIAEICAEHHPLIEAGTRCRRHQPDDPGAPVGAVPPVDPPVH